VRASVLDPIADPRWLDVLGRSPDASVFHHPAWLALLRRSYDYELSACCITSAAGDVLAGLPIAAVASRLTGRRLVALPFSDLCPPLVADDAPPEAAAALAAALGDLHRRRGVPLEVRGAGQVLAGAPPGERFHHHLVALEPDIAAVQRRFARPQAARGARRAVREGLRTQVRTDAAALETFYALHVATRRRLGVPTQPHRFIAGLRELFAAGLGFVLLVRHGQRPVAAGLYLTSGDVLTYKYGASDERFLGMRPNNLLFMEAIRWGCEHGMRRLDLGRTHWGQESLRAFKLAWGAEERELRYCYIGGTAPGGRSGRPERLLGSVIRHTPPVTGRMIGEVLYRHAG
jgi:CelD/BcsL family acetyltransferase involved in cellulose biosynthesis